MVEQVRIRDRFIVALLQNMLQMWSWTPFWKIIQFGRGFLFGCNMFLHSLIVGTAEGIHGLISAGVIQAHGAILVKNLIDIWVVLLDKPNSLQDFRSLVLFVLWNTEKLAKNYKAFSYVNKLSNCKKLVLNHFTYFWSANAAPALL